MNQATKHRIEKIRMELTLLQKMGHYSFALIPMILPAMEMYYKLTGQEMVNSFSANAQLVCFGLSALIIYFKHKELICERLYESRTDEQFKEAVFATSNKMKWSIEKLDNNGLTAIATNFWTSRDWSRIRISRHSNYVEISSIFDMFISVPDFFGTNKKHRRTFFNNYILASQVANLNDQIIEEIKTKEQEIENEPEWSLKNIIKRVIAYLFSFAFLAGGIAIWRYEGFNWLVLLLVIFGTFYIIFDIYVIWAKSRKPAHNKVR